MGTIYRVSLNMPKLTITNNYPHHIRAKITTNEIIFNQNKEAKEKHGNIAMGVDVPMPLPVNFGAGGGVATMKEQTDIQHLQIEQRGFSIIDAGMKAVLSYSKVKTSFLTLEVNIDGHYVRKIDCQELDQDHSSSISISEKGCVEKTRRSEKYLGIGRNVHNQHDPTNPANMK